MVPVIGHLMDSVKDLGQPFSSLRGAREGQFHLPKESRRSLSTPVFISGLLLMFETQCVSQVGFLPGGASWQLTEGPGEQATAQPQIPGGLTGLAHSLRGGFTVTKHTESDVQSEEQFICQ